MSGLTSVTLKKESGFIKNVGVSTAATVAAALTLKGIDSFIENMKDRNNRKKFDSVISYAKRKNPELRHARTSDMEHWMGAFNTLSPNIATDKALGASMLNTVHSYGGNLDLATAKLIADIGDKSGSKNNKGVMGEYIGSGANIVGPALRNESK